jgi:surface carbohydrate biosynthesis protein (TIGR04326 family)
VTTPSVQSALLVWDADGEPPVGDWTTLLWRSYDTRERKDVISIPQLVEDNAESLRARYLAWIYDLGETKVKGKRIVDHLEIRPGFSYWWMTLLAQKCTYAASLNIYHAIRLLACEPFCNSTEIKKIILVTSQPLLAAELQEWCDSNNRSFEQTINGSEEIPKKKFGWLLKCLPPFIVGVVACIGYYVQRMHFGNRNASGRKAIPRALMFFDIFTHFNLNDAKNGQFVSGYWTTLPKLISECEWPVNWVHSYYRHKATPQIKDARSICTNLNKKDEEQSQHVIIDDYFSLHALANSLLDIVRLKLKSISIRRFPNCHVNGSQFSFRHILGSDWHNSLAGFSPAKCLCQLNSFESYLRLIPKQRMGVYIQENQPWELALLYAWRTAGHGQIIGTPHTTIRFWDIRYFYDRRTFQIATKNALPIPDKVALNGPVARAAYDTGLGPVDRLIEVEALRFIHTEQVAAANKAVSPTTPTLNGKIVLLVATDLLDANTQIQLEWVTEAKKQLQDSLEIIVRPHPASDFSATKYAWWQGSVNAGDLTKLLKNANLIFCSNASSIAVDGYLAGKVVLTMLNGNKFNFSPLRGLSNFKTISSAKELQNSITYHSKISSNHAGQFFNHNKNLFFWKRLLS